MKICTRNAFISDSHRSAYRFIFTENDIGELPGKTDEVKTDVVICKTNGRVTCETHITATFRVLCSRCAKAFTLPFEVTCVKPVTAEEDDGLEDVILVDAGYCFDIAEEVRTQVYFEFPAKPLCREDCKGLCPVCGCDLNTGSCSCDTTTTDPRLAVLKKFTDNN